MISLSQFKANMLQLVRIMIETKMYVDVNYKDHAYRITVEDLGYDIKRTQAKRSLKGEIVTEKCFYCHKLVLNGACTNAACPSVP